jgi:hypothetical protein
VQPQRHSAGRYEAGSFIIVSCTESSRTRSSMSVPPFRPLDASLETRHVSAAGGAAHRGSMRLRSFASSKYLETPPALHLSRSNSEIALTEPQRASASFARSDGTRGGLAIAPHSRRDLAGPRITTPRDQPGTIALNWPRSGRDGTAISRTSIHSWWCAAMASVTALSCSHGRERRCPLRRAVFSWAIVRCSMPNVFKWQALACS